MEDGTYLVKRDGSIVNYGERWNYGFFVADGNNGEVIGTDHEWGALQNIIYDIASTGHTLVGIWTDGNTIYVDPVNHISDYDSAVELAKDRGELAIWDAFKGEEIYLADL